MNEEELIRALEEGTLGSVYTIEEQVKDLKDALYDARKQLKNSIPIPDNATNGEVIKAMFPYGTYGICTNSVHVYIPFGDKIQVLSFDIDWWKAQYRKEAEE